MNFRTVAVTAAAAALCLAAQAAPSDDPMAAGDPAAANDPAIVKQAEAVAGNYMLTKVGADDGCRVKFEVVGSYNMFRVWLEPDCRIAKDWTPSISGWEPIDTTGIKVVGAEGSLWAEFKSTADGKALQGVNAAEPDATFQLEREPAKYEP
jgi:hypothetical protein